MGFSYKEKFWGLKGRRLEIALGIVAGMGFALFGYDQGVMGGLLTLDDFLETFPLINAHADKSKSTLQGFVVAVYELGCFAGALFVVWKGDHFGRRKMIFFGGIIMTIGAILQTSSYSVEQLSIARVVTGVGNGFITSTIPILQSECAKPAERGKLVVLSGALVTGGVCLSYWVDFGFFFAGGAVAWRFPLAFQMVFSLFLTLVILTLPESPRWLIKNGRFQEAAEVFAALDNTTADDILVQKQIDEVSKNLEEERAAGGDKVDFRIIFRMDKKKNFHRTMLAYFVQVMQQISGINLITYYAATIFEQYINMSPLNSRILAACNGTEYFLASFIPFFAIETWGRRPLLLFAVIGQACTMAILTGTAWASDNTSHSTQSGILSAVFLFVFNTFFLIGFLMNPWLYPPEVVSLESRAAATGLSTSANWIFNFMVVMITPPSFANIGCYTYTIFAAINALMIPVIYVFYPETKGRSLEEMDLIFEKSNPKTPWDVVKIAKEMPYHSKIFNNILDEESTEELERPSEKPETMYIEDTASSEKDKS